MLPSQVTPAARLAYRAPKALERAQIDGLV